MHKLARLSDDERRRLVTDFIDDTFGRLDANAEFVDMMRSAMPDLPDDPEPDQVDAWVELAELTQDLDFRAAVRRMAQYQAAERTQGDVTGLHHGLAETVRDSVGRAHCPAGRTRTAIRWTADTERPERRNSDPPLTCISHYFPFG
ncbi:hypothetical protein AV521_45655 [Streptomyces sp. IMTB 2501]|nr:hypothetical protein AV521_45655 [Streptomyces sp. IMTB 2501]